MVERTDSADEGDPLELVDLNLTPSRSFVKTRRFDLIEDRWTSFCCCCSRMSFEAALTLFLSSGGDSK